MDPPGPPAYADQAQLTAWIEEAFEVLEQHGVPPSQLDLQDVLLIIEHESAGDPNSINDYDINAQNGDPSRGLMQTIGATFNEYALPGHDSDIYNPVDNIIAGCRYAISRYGSLSAVPGVVAVREGGSYVGY
jgi:SLT domain-containing protein